MSPTPSINGQRDTVLHGSGETTGRLGRHWRLLGFRVDRQWIPLATVAYRDLRVRVRPRPLFLRAVQQLMSAQGSSGDQAFRHLRREAKRQRLVFKRCAASILASGQARTG